MGFLFFFSYLGLKTQKKQSRDKKQDHSNVLLGGIFLESASPYLFIRHVKPCFMACNLHTCNCPLVLMIVRLLVEQPIEALVDANP